MQKLKGQLDHIMLIAEDGENRTDKRTAYAYIAYATMSWGELFIYQLAFWYLPTVLKQTQQLCISLLLQYRHSANKKFSRSLSCTHAQQQQQQLQHDVQPFQWTYPPPWREEGQLPTCPSKLFIPPPLKGLTLYMLRKCQHPQEASLRVHISPCL